LKTTPFLLIKKARKLKKKKKFLFFFFAIMQNLTLEKTQVVMSTIFEKQYHATI